MRCGSFPVKYDSPKYATQSVLIHALDHFNEHRNTLRMTTGSADLDSLIDSILFIYGQNKAILDGFVDGLLVNCVLPINEKHRFESMALYMNNVDYYKPDKSYR